MNLQALLNEETWESVYVDTDPNHMFNSFLCTLLHIFQASFPVKYVSMKDKRNWIMQGIEKSWRKKKVFTPSLRTTVIQKQKHIIFNTV
jgi:hypothetical protein